MGFKLRVSSPGDMSEPLEFDLFSDEFYVGRSIDPGERLLYAGDIIIGKNGVKLLGTTVSRRHGLFRVDGTNLSYSDLGSRNGSYLNGKKVEPEAPVELHDKDSLLISLAYKIEVIRDDRTTTEERPVISV